MVSLKAKIPYLSKEAFRSYENGVDIVDLKNGKGKGKKEEEAPKPLKARSRLDMFREMEPKRKTFAPMTDEVVASFV